MTRRNSVGAEDQEVDPVCMAAREWFTNNYSDNHAAAYRYHSDKEMGVAVARYVYPNSDLSSVAHIRGCDACTRWLEERVGERIFSRQHRLSQYCCALLFGVVEEPKRLDLPIRLEQVNAEVFDRGTYWYLSLPGIDSLGLRVNYCPFCGQSIRTAPLTEAALEETSKRRARVNESARAEAKAILDIRGDFFSHTLRNWESRYLIAKRSEVEDDQISLTTETMFRTLMSSDDFRRFWEKTRSRFDPEFSALVDTCMKSEKDKDSG